MAKYEYADRQYSQHGLMICCACKRKIESGEYRVKDTPDAYILWHRECCSTDQNWQRLDRKREAAERKLEEYKQVCRDFVKRWGYPSEGDFDV